MSYKIFIDAVKPEFEKSIQFLEAELSKVRTSRTSPALIEDIEVDCFGSKYVLKQLAAISCPEPSKMIVQPWDTSYLDPIQKAIAQSGLGMSSAVDKNVLRLSLPLLTEEYRKSLVKLLTEKAENVRQTIRKHREDAWSKIQHAQKDKKISEDEKFKGKDALQKLVDEFNEKIENLVEKKKQEIS